MNILVFSWRDPKHPQAGGAEQVMHEHMKGWIDAGHSVTLFSSKMDGLNHKEQLDGINIIRSGYQYLGVQLMGLFYFLKHGRQYHLVVDQFHGLPFFTPVFVRQKKLAVIQEIAREVWFLNDLPSPINLVVGLIGYVFEPIFFTFYRNIPFMTGSQSAKADLIKMAIPKKNITIVNHGVLLLKANLKRKEKKTTIIFLGAIAKDKGVEEALKAFSILNRKGKFQFWIVGKGTKPYLELLRNNTVELGIQEQTVFWGFVPEEKKFELLSRSHILINPSVREGWGLVNIEANSVGVPVVAYNSPGLTDSVLNRRSGVICLHNTPEELASNIYKITMNKQLHQRLRDGAITWSKNFSWQESKKLSIKLIERITNEV